MPLLSRTVFIDTQYFVSSSFFFEKEELKSLSALATAGHVKVMMADITDSEIKKKITELVDVAFAKISHSDARILKAVPEFRTLLNGYDREKITQLLLEKYKKFKNESFP